MEVATTLPTITPPSAAIAAKIHLFIDKRHPELASKKGQCPFFHNKFKSQNRAVLPESVIIARRTFILAAVGTKASV
jgi:hypothetical protein